MSQGKSLHIFTLLSAVSVKGAQLAKFYQVLSRSETETFLLHVINTARTAVSRIRLRWIRN